MRPGRPSCSRLRARRLCRDGKYSPGNLLEGRLSPAWLLLFSFLGLRQGDFRGFLVVAQAQEYRLAQFHIRGPFLKGDLRDEFRLDVGNVAFWRRSDEKRPANLLRGEIF